MGTTTCRDGWMPPTRRCTNPSGKAATRFRSPPPPSAAGCPCCRAGCSPRPQHSRDLRLPGTGCTGARQARPCAAPRESPCRIPRSGSGQDLCATACARARSRPSRSRRSGPARHHRLPSQSPFRNPPTKPFTAANHSAAGMNGRGPPVPGYTCRGRRLADSACMNAVNRENPAWWTLQRGDDCVVATAIHDGHALRPGVQAVMALDEATRLREEDPYTGQAVTGVPTHVIPHRSRFEVDLNRAEDQAVYLRPEQGWGLDIWHGTPSPELVEGSLRMHRAFYSMLGQLLDDVVA